MLGFVVPLRSKSSSNNWAYHSELVFRTLTSICNQTSKDFIVIVVYTDYPERMVENDKVIYLKYPYPFLISHEITDAGCDTLRYFPKRNLEILMDQARRTMVGCKCAIDRGCKYLMEVDADDLVSNKIAAFVERASNITPPGWFINKGFVYIEGSKIIYRYTKLNLICGSTHIVRADLLNIPDFSSKNYLDYNFFSSHSWIRIRLRTYKEVEIQPLPFGGIIYVLNPGSWTNISRKFQSTGVKKWAKLLLYGQRLTYSLKTEYCLEKILTPINT